MSNHNNVDIEANSGGIDNRIEIDPNILKQIFGVPKDEVKPVGNHTTNESARVRESYPMTQPLLATPNDRNDSTPSGPAVEDHSKNSVPEVVSGPPQQLDNHKDSIEDGTKEEPKAPQQPPHQTHEGANTDSFQWWSEEDHPPDQDVSGLAARFGETLPPLVPAPPPTGTPDVNAYQQRKNLAHGMMDLALLSANATQLRAVLEASSHPYYYPSVTFVSLSIVLQITVGILLILNSRYDVTKKSEIQNAIRVNDATVVGVFLVTIINVFIASFIGSSPPAATPAPAQ